MSSSYYYLNMHICFVTGSRILFSFHFLFYQVLFSENENRIKIELYYLADNPGNTMSWNFRFFANFSLSINIFLKEFNQSPKGEKNNPHCVRTVCCISSGDASEFINNWESQGVPSGGTQGRKIFFRMFTNINSYPINQPQGFVLICPLIGGLYPTDLTLAFNCHKSWPAFVQSKTICP